MLQPSSRDGVKKFLVNVPDDVDIHIVMDNYATHKTPTIQT